MWIWLLYNAQCGWYSWSGPKPYENQEKDPRAQRKPITEINHKPPYIISRQPPPPKKKHLPKAALSPKLQTKTTGQWAPKCKSRREMIFISVPKWRDSPGTMAEQVFVSSIFPKRLDLAVWLLDGFGDWDLVACRRPQKPKNQVLVRFCGLFGCSMGETKKPTNRDGKSLLEPQCC